MAHRAALHIVETGWLARPVEWNQAVARADVEVYAKLLAMVVQHWFVLHTSWDDPHRSLFSVAEVLREQVPTLAHGLCRHLPLRTALRLMVDSVRGGCSIPARSTRPSTSRLLAGAPLWGLT
jgi:hypothetical protein